MVVENERSQRQEDGKREQEESEREASEGSSSVSALWSPASWDSWTLSRFYTSKSITLDWAQRERHTCTRSHTQTMAHSHNLLPALSSVLVGLQQSSLSMSQRCMIADRCDVLWFSRKERGCQITNVLHIQGDTVGSIMTRWGAEWMYMVS